jgi:glycerol-3-phosphate dehydrogenase (NAD(P)+)
MKISILGCGNFGSGFGSYLESLGYEIIKEEVGDASMVFVSVPSFAVCPTLLNFKNDLYNKKVIICSKGFTNESKLIHDTLLENSINNIFFLYGPTLIDGISLGELSGMVLAGGEGKEEIKEKIQSDKLLIELSDDIVGVEVGSALKNVMAIYIGIIEGSKLGKNTEALAFTKCIKEIKTFGVSLGAKEDTFYGLSCLGDLYLHSRNRSLGIDIAKGRKLEDIIKDMNTTVEGVGTLKNAKVISEKMHMNTPIIDTLYAILFKGSPVSSAVEAIV